MFLFDLAVYPSSAFMISKTDSDSDTTHRHSTENNAIAFEQSPPTYKDTILSPPPYASINLVTQNDLE